MPAAGGAPPTHPPAPGSVKEAAPPPGTPRRRGAWPRLRGGAVAGVGLQRQHGDLKAFEELPPVRRGQNHQPDAGQPLAHPARRRMEQHRGQQLPQRPVAVLRVSVGAMHLEVAAQQLVTDVGTLDGQRDQWRSVQRRQVDALATELPTVLLGVEAGPRRVVLRHRVD